MKFMHISDLHLGKKLNEFSMLEDQEYILNQIIEKTKEFQADAMVIAGDVYDRGVPPIEAVNLLDSFLLTLSEMNIDVFIVAGNHDSVERLSFGAQFISKSGIHISKPYDGRIQPITLTDNWGSVNFYMLPFIRPSNVRRFYPECEINSYTEMAETVIEDMELNPEQRNVLIAHQFVTGAIRSDSEEFSVGGTDNIDYTVFRPFDYTALGHIHRPQNVGQETVRYCGTPLKYSFSEIQQQKSITMVDIQEKGNVQISTIPLIPKRDVREIRGTYQEICEKWKENKENVDDYLHVVLTDEDDIPGVFNKLRVLYPNIMKLDYDNMRTRHNEVLTRMKEQETKSEIELFCELFRKQNGYDLNETQLQYTKNLFESLKEKETK